MANTGERVTYVACTEDKPIVGLAEDRSISVPIAWFPRLLHATPQERDNWEIAGAGYGIHWPDIDEDLSVERLLRGAPSQRVKALSSEHRHAPVPPTKYCKALQTMVAIRW